jgi:hypothetical protein
MRALKFSESISINGQVARIFDYTQDYNTRLTWDTFLTHAELLDGAVKAEKGVKAWCVAKNGLGMETQYVSFNRPKVTAIRMTKGPYMFRDFAASWIFSEQNTLTSTVTFTYSYRLRFPYSFGGLLIHAILRRNVKQRLRDLKKNIEQTKG